MAAPGDADGPRPGGAGPDGRFGRMFAFSPVALALIAEDGTVLDVNPAMTRLLDLPAEVVRGRPMIELTHADDRPDVLPQVALVTSGQQDAVRLVKRMTGADRRAVPVRVTLLRLDEPGGNRQRLAQVEDLSSGLELAQIRREASEDPLTGVANRRALHRELDALLSGHRSDDADPDRERPASAGWSLLFVDLDDFKAINDTFGHSVGDQVLIALARRLSRITRDADLVCRLGGDEFVLLLQTSDVGDLENTAARVRRSLAQPVRVDGRTIWISASVGSAIPQVDESADQLLERADAAMYRDKRRPS